MSQSSMTYEATQLSVPPGRVRVPADLTFQGTLRWPETRRMAALIIHMVQERAKVSGKDEWVGLSVESLAEKVGEINRMSGGRHTPAPISREDFNAGLANLRERGFITLEAHDEGLGEFDVVTVTEELLKRLQDQGYIV